ncbi:MAG TPA: glycoside hydrolase family 2 TIM barrel-domain containing protein, partial [Chitinophagaceae bacterium]
MRLILTLYCFFFASILFAQRSVTNINKEWQFTKDKQGKWEPVSLPHTWNVDDVMDDVPGYYRGVGWYKRNLFIEKKYKGKQLCLLFEGANQVAEVFINGKKAGAHLGGYAAFYVPISSLINYDRDNELLVKVDNSHNQDIPPLSADFTFYGGIYRDAWLVAVEPLHFSYANNTSGVFISTPSVTATSATVQVKATITNDGVGARKIKLNSIVKNRTNKIVASVSQLITIDGGTEKTISQPLISVKNPQLWSPESPYLYNITTEIRDAATGKLLDALTNPLGFRWFHFDAAKGFFLNGKPCKLVGTSRHQDYKGMGNAVPDSLAVKDIVLLKKMGGNFLRVAHYPQDASVLAACDSLGILTSVEIPIVNEI